MALSGNQEKDLNFIQSLNSYQVRKLLSSYNTYNYALILADLPRRDVEYKNQLLIEVIKVLNKIPKKYRKEIVEDIIKQGANINLQNDDEMTALSWAAYYGNQEIVKLLLDRGADINLRNNDRDTALIWAADGGYQEIVKLLLDRGADIHHQSNFGWTALIMAAINGHSEIVKLLLDSGADIHLQDYYEHTALILAARNGHQEIVRLLLNSAEPETFTGFTQLPKYLQQEILTRLQAKVDKLKQLPLEEIRRRYPTIRSKAELTPIVLAGAASNLDLIKFLLEQAK